MLKTNRRLLIAQGVVFVALLLNAFGANTIPDYIILGIAMIIPFILEPMDIAAYIVGFSMMGTGIQTTYIAIACLLALLLKSKQKIKVVTIIAVLVFVLYELVHLLFRPEDNLMEYLRYVMAYALLFYIAFMDYDAQARIRMADSFIFGTMFCIVHIFVETLIFENGDITVFWDGSYRFGYSAQLGVDLTMAADPNLVGQSCLLVIVLCVSLFLLGYKKRKYYLTAAIALIAGTMTLSKTFIIMLAVMVLLVFLFAGSWNSSKAFKNRVIFLLFVALGCYMVMQIYPDYLENIIARAEGDATTGRLSGAQKYFAYLMQDMKALLVGVGMQNVGEKTGIGASPHAAIIEAMTCWGLVGTIAMISVLVKATVKHASSIKTRMVNYFPLIIFVIVTQSTQLFRLRDKVFAMVMVIVFVGIPQTEHIQKIASICPKPKQLGGGGSINERKTNSVSCWNRYAECRRSECYHDAGASIT